MKLLARLFILTVTISSCLAPYKTNSIAPFDTKNSFTENGKKFAYSSKDNIIVSLAFDRYTDGKTVFDLTIDNQSPREVTFDPANAHVVCYKNDSVLLCDSIYYALSPNEVLENIEAEIERLNKKIARNSVFSLLVGVTSLSSEAVMAVNSVPEDQKQEVRESYTSSYNDLQESRYSKEDERYKLECKANTTYNELLLNETLDSLQNSSGKVYFSIPRASYYKIYIPIENNIYSFRFK